MKDYKINGKVIDITLDNGKVVKCSTEWVEKSMKALETDMEDVLLMFLEDNDYIVNEEQEELDKQAKGKVKLVATKETPKKKTPKERVQKENPTKELIIQTIYNALQEIDNISSVNVENKAKLITFELNGEQFKVDLVQKRKQKV
jgi:hypothetical protein